MAPRSRRFSSCSLPRLRSQPIHRRCALVPDAAAMEQQEPVAAGRRAMALVEPGDGVDGRLQERLVALDMSRLPHRASRRAGRNESPRRCWRDDGFPVARPARSTASRRVSSVGTTTRVRRSAGTPPRELQSRELRDAEAARHPLVDERHRRIDRGHRAEQPEHAEQDPVHPGLDMEEDREAEQQQATSGAGTGIAADAERAVGAACDRPERRAKAQGGLECADGPRRSDNSRDPCGAARSRPPRPPRARFATSSSSRPRPPGELLDGACGRGCASRNPFPRNRSPWRARRSTSETRSKMTDQSTSEMWRMLVMMLRTVTLAAICLCCSSWIAPSAVRPSAARRSSSRPSMAVRAGL